MWRFLNPLIFLGTAAFVAIYNQQHDHSTMMLPGMSVLVGDDLEAQGRLSWQILLGIGIAFSIHSLVTRPRRRPDP